MSGQIINVEGSSIEIWDYNPESKSLSNKRTTTAPDTIEGVSVSKNRTWLAIIDGNDDLLVYPFNNGDLGTPVTTSGGRIEGAEGLRFSNKDDGLLFTVRNREAEIGRVDDTGAYTPLDTVDSTFNSSGWASWSQDDSLIAFTDKDHGFATATWNGTALTLADDAGVSSEVLQPTFIGNSRVFAGNRGHTTVFLYSIDSSGNLTQLDSETHDVASWEDCKPNPSGTYAVGGARSGTGTPKLWSLAGDEITEVDTLVSNIFRVAWISDNLFCVTIEGGSGAIKIFEVSADTATEVFSENGSFGQAGNMVFSQSNGPITDQELFQANYDQAGTEEPLVTALVSPSPTQRCIDSMAEWLRRDPKEWTLPVIVPIGQREHFIPLKQFNIKADEPGLRSGRDGVLKSVRFISADPSEPAICTFTAPTKD